MILVLDNYDSFTYNLVQYLGELGEDLRVYRNNKISLEEIERMKPTRIVISPGPGTPADAGITEASDRLAFAGLHRRFHQTGDVVRRTLREQTTNQTATNEACRTGHQGLQEVAR